LNKNAQAIAAAGGIESMDLTSSISSCQATATSSASWLVPIVRGSAVLYRVSTNQTNAPRIATLTAAGQTLTVTQAASTGCTFSVTPTTLASAVNGGASSFTLTASAPTCSWYVFPRVPWANISPESGTGTTALRVTVMPNFTTAIRTGNLDIAGALVPVAQPASSETLTERSFRLLFINLFGRHPSAAELAYYVADYAGGAFFVDALTNNWKRAYYYWNFQYSEEFHETARFCAGLYIGLLDRDPEVEGWRFQRDAMRAGIVNGVTIVDAFLKSAEYKARWGTPSDSEFIRLLYRYVLLREATESEVSGHVATLSTLSRTTVAYNFLHAQEYYQRIGPRLTAFLLGAVFRQRDNTPDERQYFIDNYQFNEELANQVMNGEEFKAIIR